MHLINIYYPWTDYVLAGICDVVSVYERPEIEKGHYIVRCLKPLLKAELSEQQQQVVDSTSCWATSHTRTARNTDGSWVL